MSDTDPRNSQGVPSPSIILILTMMMTSKRSSNCGLCGGDDDTLMAIDNDGNYRQWDHESQIECGKEKAAHEIPRAELDSRPLQLHFAK